jgi:dihydrofolate reductase
MRKLFVFNMTSVDGYFAGPNGELDWHNVDEEFDDFAIEQLSEVGTMLFGRITYDMMAGYWPTDIAKQEDPIVAAKMNTLPKVVVSRTPQQPVWENSTLITDDVVQEISKLKEQPGKDITIFGSSILSASLLPAGLIDEYRIMVNPVVLGRGRPLFAGIDHAMSLELLGTRPFKSGNVLLSYRPVIV